MNILVIDDDRALCRSLQIHLERAGHSVDTCHTGAEGLDRLAAEPYDLAFIDLNLPDTTGLDILRKFRELPRSALTVPVMITGVQDYKATIEAVRLGAFDYIRKPLDLDAVMLSIEKAASRRAGVPVRRSQPETGEATWNPHEIIGSHPRTIEVLKQIAITAGSQVPVLVQGETGTGKELVARALHETGAPERPFVAVNCSAVVSTLLESELFGHVKGAFTGADADRPGRLEAAGEGTVFFDEIGDMPLELQAKLLRVLQEKEFERVGSTKPIPFRARVIAATHRDLKSMVAEKTFRDDLYYRLAVSTIYVPALRERRSDIAILANSMLARLGRELHKDIQGISAEAIKRCERYAWPGNIRELNNVLTRAALLSRGPIVTGDLIQTAIGDEAVPGVDDSELKSLRDMEKAYVARVLRATGWNIKQSAEILDITRVTLRKKIEDYGLERP